RWNFVRKSNFLIELKNGSKNYHSEMFLDKNYEVSYQELKPEFGYQFSTDFKLTFNGAFKYQSNIEAFGGEAVKNLRLGSEIRYNILKKGTLVSQVNFISNDF